MQKVLILLLILTGITFLYFRSENNSKSKSLENCQAFDELANLVKTNIIDGFKVDSENESRYYGFRWRRESDELFITYPIVKNIKFIYPATEKTRIEINNAITEQVNNNSSLLSKNLPSKEKEFGLEADSLNTLSLGVWEPHYAQIWGYRKGNDLYTVIIDGYRGTQSVGDTQVSVACSTPNKTYDSFYSALNLKANNSSFFDDWLNILEISDDGEVFVVHSGNYKIMDLARYYLFDGKNLELISSDSSPVTCSTLEGLKVGRGMRCHDAGKYNSSRTVTY